MHVANRLSQERVISGIENTVWALNEDRVQRLIMCLDLEPATGWQCRGCLTLYVRGTQPETCLSCGSAQMQTVDLRSEMIALAYRQRCSIEIRSRCSQLEEVGGVGALLTGNGTSPRVVEPWRWE